MGGLDGLTNGVQGGRGMQRECRPVEKIRGVSVMSVTKMLFTPDRLVGCTESSKLDVICQTREKVFHYISQTH